jgi:AraC-like DNA-binding protein
MVKPPIDLPMDIIDVKTDRLSIGPYQHKPDGRQVLRPQANLPRHKHMDRYACIVLSGGLEECGSHGRLTALPGNTLMHNAFDTHLNHIFISGAVVLNLRLPGLAPIAESFGNVADPDAIARLAEHDLIAAVEQLLTEFKPLPVVPQDWPDLLAADLIEDPNRRLEDWAKSHNLASETVSRGFSRVFGISPRAFRAEIRAKRAFEQIIEGTELLGKVLERSGFSDTANMSKAVRSLTGALPSTWINRASFKNN